MGLGLWIAIGVNALVVLIALCICAARYFQCLPCFVKRSSEETTEEATRPESQVEGSSVSAQESSSAAGESESSAAGESSADHEVAAPIAVAEPSAGGESSADHDVSIVAESAHVAEIPPPAEGQGDNLAE